MHLTFRQLHYFVAIIDAGTMAGAAAKLNVAPTALSLQVKTMEENSGLSLLERHSRGVTPTAAGKELYRRATDILRDVSAAERVIAADHPSARSIRLGLPPSALRLIGLNTILGARARFPGVVVQLFECYSHETDSRLRDGDLDFVITSQAVSSPGFQNAGLFEEDLVFITHPSQARPAGTVTLPEALKSDLAFFRESSASWSAVHSAAEDAGLNVNVAHMVESMDMIRQMVCEGFSAAILSFGVVAQEFERGDLTVHSITGPQVKRRMTLTWRSDDSAPEHVRDFSGLVLDVVSRLEEDSVPHIRLLDGQPRATRSPASASRSKGDDDMRGTARRIQVGLG